MKRLNFDKKLQRSFRHQRTTNKFKLIANNRPRLVVTKTNAHIIAQLINDQEQKTIASSSSIQLKLPNGNIKNSELVGRDIAKKILKLGIKEVCFDRGGSKYHGKIAKLASAAREEGLIF